MDNNKNNNTPQSKLSVQIEINDVTDNNYH